MDKRLSFVTEIFLLLFSFSIALVWLYFELRSPFIHVSLPLADIKPDTGNAYITKIPRPPLRDFVRLKMDAPDMPHASLLELYEDGRQLGPSDSLPDLVRKAGKGSFSRRGRDLLFSTFDNSSPLNNHRTYFVRVPLAPTSLFRLLGWIALLTGLWRAIVLLPTSSRQSVPTAIRRAIRWLVMPRQLSARWVISTIVALAVVGASWYSLVDIWASAKTVGQQFSVGGFFQVSDASGYAVCANRVLEEGISGLRVPHYGGEWCLRRPIYATFLATILGLTGRSWIWMLLAQSAFVALSITVLLRAGSRLAGPITAVVVFWLMFSFAAENAYPATATESAGLALGAVGLALLLDSMRLGHQRLLFLGTACLSLALNARAGALFVLPFLVVGVFFQHMPWRSRLSATAVAIAGIVSGFAVQSFLIHHFGGTSGASHSNFAYTLYGLAVGGKGWSQVFNDHPELFRGNLSDAQAARLVFDLAWTNVVVSPWMIAKALAKNLFHYLRDPLLGMAGLRILWWLGALAIAARWRELPYRIVGLMSFGVWLSSSVVIQDGGPRIFAATWGITAVQVAFGVHLVLTWFCRIFNPAIALNDVHRTRPHPAEICLAVLLVAAIFLPLTPLRNLVSLDPVHPRGCSDGEKELIARLGHESYMIVLVGDGQAKNLWQMQASANDLRRGLRGAWFEEGFAHLPVPATVIHGYQLMSGEGQFGFGSDVRLVWRGDLGRLVGQTVSFCFQPDVTVSIADVKYYLARSAQPFIP